MFTNFELFNVSDKVSKDELQLERLGEEYFVVYADTVDDAVAAIYSLAKNCRESPPYVVSIVLFVKETMDTLEEIIEKHWRPIEEEGEEA